MFGPTYKSLAMSRPLLWSLPSAFDGQQGRSLVHLQQPRSKGLVHQNVCSQEFEAHWSSKRSRLREVDGKKWRKKVCIEGSL